MLILEEKNIDNTTCLEISSSNNWDAPDTQIMVDCVLIQIRKRLEQSQKIKEKIVLIWTSKNGTTPPWTRMLQIINFMISISKLLDSCVLYNVVVCINKDQEFWVNKVLSIYTPKKPLKLARNNADILSILSSY